MKIENFTMDQYDTIINLWRKSGISLGSSDKKEEIERIFQRNPTLFLIGKIYDKVIGVVMGGSDGRRGYVHHLAIDPDYQRNGYGKMILDCLIASLKLPADNSFSRLLFWVLRLVQFKSSKVL